MVTTLAPADDTRRQAILDAALETFLANSVAGTTIDAIRRRSGVSVGCIYHHFASKEQLAAELYLDILREYQRGFITTLRSSRSAESGVQDAVRHHLAWVAANPTRASYLFHCREPEVTDASDARAQDLNTAFYAEAAAWLSDKIDAGEIRPLPKTLYHALWMGPSLEYSRQWLALPRRRAGELRAATAAIADAAWQALRRSS
jgi:AcrR family transcriptional regulator